MEQTIKLISKELRLSKDKSKSYTVYKTDQGDMSCFEEEFIKILDELMDQHVSIEVVEKQVGEVVYKNIRGINAEPAKPVTTERVTEFAPKIAEQAFDGVKRHLPSPQEIKVIPVAKERTCKLEFKQSAAGKIYIGGGYATNDCTLQDIKEAFDKCYELMQYAVRGCEELNKLAKGGETNE